jgi:hypothetical protein
MPAAAGLGDVEALGNIPPEALVGLAITVRHRREYILPLAAIRNT